MHIAVESFTKHGAYKRKNSNTCARAKLDRDKYCVENKIISYSDTNLLIIREKKRDVLD